MMFNRVRNFTGRINKALKDPERKSAFKLFTEYTWYKISNAAIAEQYFEKYLYRREISNPEDFIVTRKVMFQMWSLNNPRYVSILRDKYLTELFFSSFGIPIVKSIAFNRNSIFFFNGNQEHIIKVEDFRKFLVKLKESNYWKSKYLIIKMKSDSAGGKNIFRISGSDLEENNETLKWIFKQILKSEYLFQNFIIQHPELNRVNPNTVNTIRIDTFTNQKGEIKIFNIMLRSGSGNHFVDNAGQGGMAIGIEPDFGILYPEAYTLYSNFDPAISRKVHPVTGMIFQGFQVPFFNEAKQLALDAAEKLPQVKLAGWDIAIQPEGPILIEGNNNAIIPLYEILQKGFKNNPVVHEILREAYGLKSI